MERTVVGMSDLRTQASSRVDVDGRERQRDTRRSESRTAPLEMRLQKGGDRR